LSNPPGKGLPLTERDDGESLSPAEDRRDGRKPSMKGVLGLFREDSAVRRFGTVEAGVHPTGRPLRP
jgi:hypothetical protein